MDDDEDDHLYEDAEDEMEEGVYEVHPERGGGDAGNVCIFCCTNIYFLNVWKWRRGFTVFISKEPAKII